MKSSLSIFSFMGCAFDVVSKYLLPNLDLLLCGLPSFIDLFYI